MKKLPMTGWAAMAAVTCVAPLPLEAGVLIYEGFNYNLADNTSIDGAAATGSGLTGNWSASNVTGGGGSASSVYIASGLTFGGNYATSNGALLTSTVYNGGVNNSTNATVRLDTTTTGTLWSSYLISWSTISGANGGYTLQGIAGSSSPPDNTTIFFRSQMNSNILASDRKVGVAYDGTSSSSGNTPLATGTTYLYVSKFTNVGTPLSAGATGVASTWVLTLAQYNALYQANNLTEAGLNAAGAVTQKVSDAAVTSGTYGFDGTRYLDIKADAPDTNGGQTVAVWDEIKYGTDIADVLGAVPEPSHAVLLAAGLSVFGVVRRRRDA